MQSFQSMKESYLINTMKQISCTEKLFKALELLIMLGLLVAAVFFVKDVWNKFQAKDTSTKISTQELKNMNDRPTITICFDPNAKQSALDKFDITIEELTSSEFRDPNVSISYPELYHSIAFRIGIDFNITLELHEKRYTLLIDREDISEEISQIIDFEVIYTLWKGLCYKITQKIKVEEDLMNSLYIDGSINLPDEDIPNHVEVYFTSENNQYGVISLRWIDGDELGFVLNPKEKFYYYTDLTIHQYEYAKKQKSSGQGSCSQKSIIECTTLG